jgi:hypothetical protein
MHKAKTKDKQRDWTNGPFCARRRAQKVAHFARIDVRE